MLRKFTGHRISQLVIFDSFSKNYCDKSYLKLIIYPLAFLVPTVWALKDSGSFSFAFTKMAIEEVAVGIAIYAFAMQVIVAESSLVDIFVRKFEDAYAVFHAAAPISLILCSWKEIVVSVAIDLIIDETAWILFSWLVSVIPPSALHSLLHLTFVDIAIFVFDAESAVS